MKYSFLLLSIFYSCTYNELIPVCQPDQQVFEDLVQPIIDNSCVSCHNESSGRPTILTTYDGVIDAINNYELRDEVTSLRMPQYGSPPLSPTAINILTDWIDCE